MPSRERNDSRTPPIPPGATAEQILQHLLPIVIDAASRAAEGSTASASAVQSFEGAIDELKAAVDRNTTALNELKSAQVAANKQADDKNAWLRTLVQPQIILPFVFNTLLLILGLFGYVQLSPEKAVRDQLQEILIQQEQVLRNEQTGGD